MKKSIAIKNYQNIKPIKFAFFFMLVMVLAGVACEGPTGPTGPEGPQGNANVTMYRFDGHDFEDIPKAFREIEDIRRQSEMHNNIWLVYLVSGILVYHIPGNVQGSDYRVSHFWDSNSGTVQFLIGRITNGGTFQRFGEIRIIRIAPGEIVGKQKPDQGVVPASLDVSDYKAVIGYYGLEP